MTAPIWGPLLISPRVVPPCAGSCSLWIAFLRTKGSHEKQERYPDRGYHEPAGNHLPAAYNMGSEVCSPLSLPLSFLILDLW